MPKFHRVVYAVLDTITSATETEEDARKDAEDILREQNGCAADKSIIRITSHEEDVEKPLSLEDVLKVEEPLREWPSLAAISAHENNGGRWLGELKHPNCGVDVRISTFYSGGRAFSSYNKSYDSEYLRFGPVDKNYNRVPWPKDKEGNLL